LKRNIFKIIQFFQKNSVIFASNYRQINSDSSDLFVLYGYFFIKKGIKYFANTLFFILLRQMILQNKRIFASILFVLISFVCTAQLGGDPPPPMPPPPPGLPVDGMVLIVLALGLIYGIKKKLEYSK